MNEQSDQSNERKVKSNWDTNELERGHLNFKVSNKEDVDNIEMKTDKVMKLAANTSERLENI